MSLLTQFAGATLQALTNAAPAKSNTGNQVQLADGSLAISNGSQWIVENESSDPALVRLTVVTGFSIPVALGTLRLRITPAGTLAAGSITLPPHPADSQTFDMNSTQTVTALSVNAGPGQSIVGAPTTVSAAVPFGMIYDLATATWYRNH